MQKILLICFLLLSITLGIFFLHQWWENKSLPSEHKLFVYGTLKNPLVRLYACRCIPESIENATLQGYMTIESELTIEEKEGEEVHGYILTLTMKELERIDRYERKPHKYRREIIEISGQKMWVYIKN